MWVLSPDLHQFFSTILGTSPQPFAVLSHPTASTYSLSSENLGCSWSCFPSIGRELEVWKHSAPGAVPAVTAPAPSLYSGAMVRTRTRVR